MTSSFWLKTSTANTYILGKVNFLLCASLPVARWFANIEADGTLRTVFHNHSGTQDQDFTTSAAVDDNVWHHIVITRSGATVSIYIDGVLDTANVAGYTVDVVDDGGSYEIGNIAEATCTAYFVGLLDEVRNINNAAWDADRVLAEYNAQQNTKNPSTFFTVT